MSAHALKPLPLTRERFLPFGDVIEAAGTQRKAMNVARFERFDDLCDVNVGADGRVCVSIARCRSETKLPYRFDVVERIRVQRCEVIHLRAVQKPIGAAGAH